MKSRNKNLTVSLPAALIRDAKVVAAKRGTSVNSLVRESLETLVRSEDEYAAALQRILESAKRGAYKMGNVKWSREELYER